MGKLREESEKEKDFKADETEEDLKVLKTFDATKKVINFLSLKATDLKNNKRIIITDVNDDAEAIRMNYIKTELKAVFMKEHCDEKGDLLDNNMTMKQGKAIKDLKVKMKKEDLVCIETDKTGKFALDTKLNYMNKMQKHIEHDQIITTKDVTKIENKLNAQAEHVTNITKAGENVKGHPKRIKSNLKTKDNSIPALHGTSKDHKEVKDEKKGPEVRPIMGAVVGPNIALSNFLGKEIVRRIAEDANNDTVCKSTEELLSRIETYNKDRIEKGFNKKKMILASMDIEKWYQNTLARPSTKVIMKMLIESELKFVGIEYDDVSKFLGEEMSKEENIKENFQEIVYMKNENLDKKKHKKENKKTMKIPKETNNVEEILDVTLASGHEARKAHKVIQNQEELYLKPIRNPTEQEKRNILVKCIEIMIISSLENHVYKFGDQIRKQSKGGPIGLALTGEIAECYMINWDKEFLERLKSVDMNPAIYERFKDDITVVVESLEAGTRWKDGALIVDLEKKNDDEGRTDEEITMEVFKDIAESIDDMISFTVDYPGNHKNGKMPVLDVQAAINKEEEN